MRARILGALVCALFLVGGSSAQSKPVRNVPARFEVGGFGAISTPDAKGESTWWQQMLGFEVLREGAAPDGRTRFALLRRDGYLLEIVQRAGADPASERTDRSFAHGIFKLGLVVSNLDEVERDLRKRGARFVHGIVQPQGNPYRSLAVLDPDGNTVQLFGP